MSIKYRVQQKSRQSAATLARLTGYVLVTLAVAVSTVVVPVSGDQPSNRAWAADYPYPYAQDCTEAGSDVGCIADRWSFYQGQCTSWVAWRLNDRNGVAFTNSYRGVHWGNASNWRGAALSLGIKVDTSPGVGSVAYYSGRNHVAYVEAVNSDGSIRLSEMNFNLHNGRRELTVRPGQSVGRVGGWPSLFIHIKDLASTTQQDYRRSIMRDAATGAAYLIRDDGKRYHIPTGGDYQAIRNNGVPVYNVSRTEINRYPDSGKQAKVVRRDDPTISGPTSWLHRVTGVGSAAYGGDFVWTTSAAGKNYVTNTGHWNLYLPSPGVYRLNCFIPNRSEAWAGVVYKVYDGSAYEFSKSVKQANHIGMVTLGQARITSGVVKIRLPDNLGSGPYNAKFAYDACEAVPIR